MISTLENKTAARPRHKPYATVTDGSLGGCGYGEIGDPQTYLPEVWQAALTAYDPRTVLDLGCGFGYSAKWFEDHGCEALGIEGSQAIVDKAVTAAVRQHDFTTGPAFSCPDPQFDLCWCSEFLEHVDARYLPHVFEAIERCKVVIVAAAMPGFGGHHHVNEQPPAYWIARFAEHGFRHDAEASERLRRIAREADSDCYFYRSGLVFIRDSVPTVPAEPRWQDVDGWLSEEEGEALQYYARGRRVLELGTWLGRSAICLAATAEKVTTVDHHRGDANTGESSTLSQFLSNVERHGLQYKIEPIVGRIEDLRDQLTARRFDLIFIDGQHDHGAVARDTLIALECLAPGGTVVWHDWQYADVKAGAAEAGVEPGMVTDLGGLGVMRTQRHQVAIVMPHSGSCHVQAVKSAMQACQGRYAERIVFSDRAFGCLTNNFNTFLALALGLRDKGLISHLYMQHSDISTEAGAADLLAEEMCLTRSIVMSGIVAIKDPDDDRTSTAVGTAENPWDIDRYIRLRDRGKIPETFTAKNVCKPGEVLLNNTGCMLIDLRDEFWDTFCFRVVDRITKSPDGKRCAQFRPEDWEMSRDLHAAGKPYGSTFRVKTTHHGTRDWPNRLPAPTEITGG